MWCDVVKGNSIRFDFDDGVSAELDIDTVCDITGKSDTEVSEMVEDDPAEFAFLVNQLM